MKKRLALIYIVVFAVVFAFSVSSPALAATPTETEVYNTLNGMKAQYPEGTPWGVNKTYVWNGGIYSTGTGCTAFAYMLSDAAFGDLPARMVEDVDFSQVRAGDILRMNDDANSVIVLRVYEDYLVLAEGAYNGTVHWGRVLTVEEVENSDYMLTRYPEGSSGGNADTPQIPTENLLASGYCGEDGKPNVKWALASTGELFIYGTEEMDNYSLSVPWSGYANRITSVTFLGEVKNVASYGFRSLTKLESVTICDSVEEIGVNAFENCTSLRSVVMGNGVKTIYGNAFVGCTSLTSITLPDSLETLYTAAFARTGLKHIALPEGLTYLGSNAFEECDSLVSAYIPGTVNNNFQYIFYACDKLSSVTMGEGLQEIGRYSFAECPALKSVTFPSSMREIGDNAFNGSGLVTAVLPEGITALYEYAFYSCDNLKSVSIPSTVTTFESNVFAYCKALEKVTLAEGLSSLGNAAFQYCQSLKNITIPGSIKEIKVYTFAHSGLQSVVLSEGVTSIAKYAFEYSEDLEVLTLPSTLQLIGNGAFDRCESLKDVYYCGSRAQWASVNVQSGNYNLDYVNFHYMAPNDCRHTWQEATCTEPKTCTSCGEIQGSANGHNWKAANCTEAKTCRTCGEIQGSANGHNWKAATCTRAKTCLTCGQTQGNANGHNWKAATCTQAKTCRTCGEIQGTANGHAWKEATCTEAKLCKNCSASEGKPKGHISDGVTDCAKESKCKICGLVIRAKGEHAWEVKEILSPSSCTTSGKAVYYCLGCLTSAQMELPATGHTWQEATCTQPKTCETCATTEGEPNGHSWKEATCTEARTCSICSVTDGDPAGHNWRDATCQSAKLCLTCLLSEGKAADHSDEDADGECDRCGETLNPSAPGEDPDETPDDKDPQTPVEPQPSVPDVSNPTVAPSQPSHTDTPADDGNLWVVVLCIAVVLLGMAAIILCIVLRKKRAS